MSYHRLVMLIGTLLALGLPSLAPGQDEVSVSASVRTNRMYIGDEMHIEVLVEGSDNPRQPEDPSVEGASLRYLGGSNVSRSFTMIVNGRRTERSTRGYTFQYALSPTRPGRIVIPPIEVEVDGRTYKTEPILIEAIEPQTDNEFALEIAIDEDRVYVGQPVRARVTWFIAATVNEFSFRATPLPEGFDVHLPSAGQAGRQTIDFELFGRRISATQSRARRGNMDYPVLTFDITLIPQETGRLSVGPMNVVFSRRDAMRVQRRQCISNELELEVLPLPTDGRPSDFDGLVGVYGIRADASPTSVAVGDPIELSVTISGPEPLTRIEAPDLSLDAGFSESFKPSPDGWRRQPVTTPGSRRFTTTIRARSDRVTEIPPIRLPYFDARSGEYSEAMSDAIELEVRPVRQVTAADAITGPGRSPPSLSRTLERAPDGIWALETDPDRILRGDGIDLLAVARSPVTIGAVAVPPAVYAGVVVAGFVRKRRDPVGARRRRALSHARRVYRSRGAAESVCAFTGALLDRPSSSVTGRDCLDLLANPTPDTRLLATTLTRAEAGRFGNAEPDPEPNRGELLAAMRRIDRAFDEGSEE